MKSSDCMAVDGKEGSREPAGNKNKTFEHEIEEKPEWSQCCRSFFNMAKPTNKTSQNKHQGGVQAGTDKMEDNCPPLEPS